MIVEPNIFLEKSIGIGAGRRDLKQAVLELTACDIPFNIARACGHTHYFVLNEEEKDISLYANLKNKTINRDDLYCIEVFKMLKHIAD